MNRREFLKKGLEGIVIGSIPLISSCGKNPVDSEESGVIYFMKTIRNNPIETVKKEYFGEFPLEIKLVAYKPDDKFEGSVKLITLGWLNIINYDDYTGNPKNWFYVDTKGKLGPVEFIIFDIKVITEKNMKGTYCHGGPLIDTGGFEFTAETK